uniref:Protein-L-isoaspartate (D-aspartate) O-methyltransferase domain containing 1 n=1 Tax=Bos indicus x Bos taurus TaxID=30522 RepID=A0A4W2I7Y3_BOBOX
MPGSRRLRGRGARASPTCVPAPPLPPAAAAEAAAADVLFWRRRWLLRSQPRPSASPAPAAAGPPTASPQVTSTCRGFTGFQHQVSLRSCGHCIFQADQQTGYLIFLCLLHISSSVCTRF